jgi:hypothetical protein
LTPEGRGAMKFNHVGIPTTTRFEGETDLPHLKVTVSDHQSNAFGIQWQRYWEGAPVPDLMKTVAHVAFEVDDLELALRGHDVIIPPNSPSAGVIVAFIKVAGAPVELLQIVPDEWTTGPRPSQMATASITIIRMRKTRYRAMFRRGDI